MNQQRYGERQLEEIAEHPDQVFEFEVLEEIPPNSERPLDVAEEDWIRAGGGPQSTGGRLQNQRHQMNPQRYRDAGGDIDYP